jgi:hypothetical protein
MCGGDTPSKLPSKAGAQASKRCHLGQQRTAADQQGAELLLSGLAR